MVLRCLRNAFCAVLGNSANWASVGPCLSTTGLFVTGEMVVIVSTDMMAVVNGIEDERGGVAMVEVVREMAHTNV